MCAQQRLKSVCASAKSDQTLLPWVGLECVLWYFLIILTYFFEFIILWLITTVTRKVFECMRPVLCLFEQI